MFEKDTFSFLKIQFEICVLFSTPCQKWAADLSLCNVFWAFAKLCLNLTKFSINSPYMWRRKRMTRHFYIKTWLQIVLINFKSQFSETLFCLMHFKLFLSIWTAAAFILERKKTESTSRVSLGTFINSTVFNQLSDM